MQETVSGYKFSIFHHCPGGRVWDRQAVVELAAWGFGHSSPANGSWKTGPISLQKDGLCPREHQPWF